MDVICILKVLLKREFYSPKLVFLVNKVLSHFNPEIIVN